MTWAQRLKRVFGIEIETCEQCGGEGPGHCESRGPGGDREDPRAPGVGSIAGRVEAAVAAAASGGVGVSVKGSDTAARVGFTTPGSLPARVAVCAAQIRGCRGDLLLYGPAVPAASRSKGRPCRGSGLADFSTAGV